MMFRLLFLPWRLLQFFNRQTYINQSLFNRLVIPVMLLFAAVSSLFADPAYADSPSILIYGDSLSAAYGIPREQGWVALLQQRLKDEKLDYQVINTSISGETTTGGASRIATTLKNHRPDLILVELGANDGLRGLPLNEMQSNLQKIIEASLQAKAQVVLIGMMIPPNYGPRYAREFNETYTNLAKRYQLTLVPFLLADVAGKIELTLDDGLHPTAQAQPAVLENVWKVLKPALIKRRAN